MNRLAALAFSSAVALSLTVASAAIADDFMLQYAAVVGAGKQVTMTRVPIVATNGAVTYKDVTVLFALGTGNTLVMAPGYPKTVNSPALQTGNFTPGQYYYVNGSDKIVATLAGPSIGPANRAAWTLSSANGKVNMIFYAGPISGHPMQTRLVAAKIAASGASFGLSSSDYGYWQPAHRFNDGAIVALAVTGGDISIQSYTDQYLGKDSQYPVGTIVFRKCSGTVCN